MRRRRHRRADPSDDDETEGEDDFELLGRPHRARPRPRPVPVKPWKSAQREGEPDEPEEEIERTAWRWFGGPRRPVFFRARDSLYFEPLVALAIVVVMLSSLYAYAQNWPPVYVVRSDSMQHGSHDGIGLINTGDLVIAQRVGTSDIIPYVVGAQTGYTTYGEYGDVLLYHPNGSPGGDPIIHRAIVYIEANPDGTYSIPELAGLPCGSAPNAVYSVTSRAGGCGTTELQGPLTLYRIGWQSATVNVSLTAPALGARSGFLTMGDNNLLPGNPPRGLSDDPTLTFLVQPAWVVGAARGMIPWFGAIKLLFVGEAGPVPTESWQWLGITILGVLLVGAAIHYALRAEGIEDERRKELEEEEEEEAEEAGRPHRRWRVLRRWSPDGEDDEEEESEERRPRREDSRRLLERLQPRHGWFARRGGRPTPTVRRDHRHPSHRRRRTDPDDDEEL